MERVTGAKVGVVVPAFNAAKFVWSTLSSIASQTHGGLVCIVVDDGSSDGTPEIARQFCETDRRFSLLEQSNAGPCAARNAGLDALPPDVAYVSFMDADDVWCPHAIESLLELLACSLGCVGAHGLGEFIDEDGHPLQPGVFAAMGRGRVDCAGGWPRPVGTTRATSFGMVMTASVMFPPGLMVARRDLYDAIGGFDERVRFAEDWNALIELARHGDIAFLDEVVLQYRRHATNVGASAAVPGACRRVRVDQYHSPKNSPAQQRVARESYRAAQVIEVRERLARMHAALRSGRVVEAAAQAARLPSRASRYVRGRPSQQTVPG